MSCLAKIHAKEFFDALVKLKSIDGSLTLVTVEVQEFEDGIADVIVNAWNETVNNYLDFGIACAIPLEEATKLAEKIIKRLIGVNEVVDVLCKEIGFSN